MGPHPLPAAPASAAVQQQQRWLSQEEMDRLLAQQMRDGELPAALGDEDEEEAADAVLCGACACMWVECGMLAGG
jgi:hypothetical protein